MSHATNRAIIQLHSDALVCGHGHAIVSNVGGLAMRRGDYD